MELVTQPSTVVKVFPEAIPWFLGRHEGLSPRPLRCLKITVICGPSAHSPENEKRQTNLRIKAPSWSPQSARGPSQEKRSEAQSSSKLTHQDLRPGGSGTAGPPICHLHSGCAGGGFASPWRRSEEAGPKSPSSSTTRAGGQGKQSRRLKVLEVGSVGAGRRGCTPRGGGAGRRRFLAAPRALAAGRSGPRRKLGVSRAKPFA